MRTNLTTALPDNMRIRNWRSVWPVRLRSIPHLPTIANHSTFSKTQSQSEDFLLTALSTITNRSNSDLDEPESDAEETTTRQEWTRGVLFCAYGTLFVLLLNIILAAVAMSRTYGIYESEISQASPIYKGDCSKSRGWAIGLHLIINVLSTIMLAATNYCMQCLGAPSRADIDDAHARQRWLEIGTPSMRNLRFFGRRHIILWVLLLVSSMPIHLLYNSAIFSTLATTDYPVFITSDTLDYRNLVLNSTELKCFSEMHREKISDYLNSMVEGDFEYLSNKRCLETFTADFVSGRGALVLLSNELRENNDTVLWSGFAGSYPTTPLNSWMNDQSDPVSSPGLEKWSTAGLPWRVLELEVEYPGINRTGFFTTGTNYSVERYPDYCYNQFSEVADLCSDIHTLDLALHPYIDKNEVNEFLRQRSHWKNSSWAREVTVQEQLVCPVPSKEPNQALSNFPPEMTYAVNGCLSQKIRGDCQVLFSLPVCFAVLGCNIIKVICMFLTARDSRTEKFLTVGDAVSSFLSRPDRATTGRCLMSKLSLSSGPQSRKRKGIDFPKIFRSSYRIPESRFPEILPTRKRWFHAASALNWMITMVMGVTCLMIAGYLLHSGIRHLQNSQSDFRVDIKGLWNLGFGSITPSNMVELDFSGVIPMVLLANSPQLIVSMTYFLYNSLLTRMLLAAEYNAYAIHRKSLRVSWPKGQQRSSYYLSLPYKFSLSLIVTSALLHWLISQSIFYVQVVSFDFAGNPKSIFGVSTCGYSPIAIIFAIIVGSLLLLAAPVLGARRFISQMPLAANCSAAISASCHPPEDDKDAALKPVMWGEIRTAPEPKRASTEAGDRMLLSRRWEEPAASDVDARYDPAETTGFDINTNNHPRCSFTSQEVNPPNPARFYS